MIEDKKELLFKEIAKNGGGTVHETLSEVRIGDRIFYKYETQDGFSPRYGPLKHSVAIFVERLTKSEPSEKED